MFIPEALSPVKRLLLVSRARQQQATRAEFSKSGGRCQAEFSFPGTFFELSRKPSSGLENYSGKTALAGLHDQLADGFNLIIGIGHLLAVELDPTLLDQTAGLTV